MLGHVDEVKELILESVNARKNYKMRMPSRSSAGATRPSRSAHGRSYVYSQLSGLEDVGFNDFIKDDFIQEGDGQVASGSASLPDRVAGMSVENVPAVVNIKALKGRFIAHKFSTGGGEECGKKESAAGQFAVKYKSETHCRTKKLSSDDYGVDKYFLLL